MTVTVHRADTWTWVPKNIAPNSIPLMILDPPYGRIVKKDWDKHWSIDKQWKMTDLINDKLMMGGTAYVWGGIGKPKDRIFYEWFSQLERRYPQLVILDQITWSKKRAYGLKDRYLFTREEIAFIVKVPDNTVRSVPRTFNVPLLDKKRGYAGYDLNYPAKSEFLRRTDVWTDITEIFKGKIHEAEKPSELAKIMIETSSRPGEMVLDFFAGSGSTGVAALECGRECILIEESNCKMHIIEPLVGIGTYPSRSRRSGVITNPAALLAAAGVIK